MATSDEIRAQIAARQQELAQAKAEYQRVDREADEAEERQKLRRELEDVDHELTDVRFDTQDSREYRQNVDQDKDGPHVNEVQQPVVATKSEQSSGSEVAQGQLDCDADVVSGELEWSIKGFSWLEDAILQRKQQYNRLYVSSPQINVAGHLFKLVYHPKRDKMGLWSQVASLAILHQEHPNYVGVAFRYTMSIKSKDRGYVQWGDTNSIYTGEGADFKLFGPDVSLSLNGTPSGIFGMDHAQLKSSEWVINDVLTARLKVQVRPNVDWGKSASGDVLVPPSRLGDNLLSLLDQDVGTDIAFKIQGETIKAHSQILSASSEVLQRLFYSGMQESTSKEVIIDDCEPIIFKAFLRYLYNDDFASVEGIISSGASNASVKEATMSRLQSLLATSHKYQVTRLQMWCQRKLRELISIEQVCSVLVQAHLYEAKQLEKWCLDFIAANMSEVVKTESFISVSHKWPEVSLKITMRLACLSEGIAATAISLQENSRKRKRDD